MKRVLGHCLVGLAAAAACGAIGSAACVHDDSSFYVENVMYPPISVPGQGCLYQPSGATTSLAAGTLDVSINGSQSYAPEFLLANDLKAQATNSTGTGTETSVISIEGAIVRVTDTAGNPIGSQSFTSLTSGTIQPGAGGTVGLAAIGAMILDPKTVESLNVPKNGPAQVVTYTKFFGHTLGGTYIDSNEFEFAVTVCDGCLIQYGEDLPTYPASYGALAGQPAPQPNCLGATPGMSSASAIQPCVYGQDQIVDCANCQGVSACQGRAAGVTPPSDGGAG